MANAEMMDVQMDSTEHTENAIGHSKAFMHIATDVHEPVDPDTPGRVLDPDTPDSGARYPFGAGIIPSQDLQKIIQLANSGNPYAKKVIADIEAGKPATKRQKMSKDQVIPDIEPDAMVADAVKKEEKKPKDKKKKKKESSSKDKKDKKEKKLGKDKKKKQKDKKKKKHSSDDMGYDDSLVSLSSESLSAVL